MLKKSVAYNFKRLPVFLILLSRVADLANVFGNEYIGLPQRALSLQPGLRAPNFADEQAEHANWQARAAARGMRLGLRR